ncbi:nicotinate-nucleotide--dimethylbenzimidazole phosphoribosyltransferase [Gymnodinialimonas sp. 2305UL16-5]|uniref:nicotinate-nucleotide--dimethylbenzimidazole phosphoribosyltransferase n=1 Tax=Gymnodinialimonas mytili TaxID=3126503 RepID=UPI0030951D13
MSEAPQSFEAIRAALAAAPHPAPEARAAAEARNAVLTKPPGALGRLEELAIWYAAWRGDARPRIKAPQVLVFAGNHGVCAQGVSAFPPEVTVQMVANFAAGGAAINQLSDLAEAKMSVHPIELDRPTADFTQGPAMSEAECLSAFAVGWEAVDLAADLLVVGEMGIGNTTSAAALAYALFGGAASDWTGRGTGVDDAGLEVKTRVVEAGISSNPEAKSDPLVALAALGGREIAAMAGAMARARCLGLPVILDGFICTAAAAVIHKVDPGGLDHAVAGHGSAEQAHGALLAHLGKDPILALDMRLGEGSGAALAIQILRGALACHSGMASFTEAGVSDG